MLSDSDSSRSSISSGAANVNVKTGEIQRQEILYIYSDPDPLSTSQPVTHYRQLASKLHFDCNICMHLQSWAKKKII